VEQKWSKSGAKVEQKWSKSGAKVEPKWSQSGEKGGEQNYIYIIKGLKEKYSVFQDFSGDLIFGHFKMSIFHFPNTFILFKNTKKWNMSILL